MSNKNGLFRLKAEFENIPIMKAKKHLRDEEDFDEMIGELKIKLFGK